MSVVVCAYTEARWEVLRAALASLDRQTAPPAEVILVVDHNDTLLARARRAFPRIRVMASTGRAGLSGARNTGWEAARGDVVAFLDDDALAAPDWTARIAAAMADADVLGVGGTVRPRWAHRRPRWFPEEFDWVVGCTYRGVPITRAEVRNMIGASMALRRELLADVGGFRSELGRLGTAGAGCEETELCIRARALRPAGRILHEPALHAEHHVTADRATLRYFVRRCRAEGRSKARVSATAGAGAALSAERAYVRRVLPAAVVRGVGDALRGDPAGLGRSAAVVVGLLATASGYAAGRALHR